MNNREFVAAKAVERFCMSEAEEYSYLMPMKVEDVEECASFVYVTVEFQHNKSAKFRASGDVLSNDNPDLDDVKLEVELGEDVYYETNIFSWRVKYFWMALLEW